MIWRQNTCVNWFPFESHPENSGHPVRYYRRCQCLGSSHMVIVRLVVRSHFLDQKLGPVCHQIGGRVWSNFL